MRAAADSVDLVAGATPFLDRVEQHLTELLAGHDGVVADSARASIAAGGKRLRPLLVWAGRPAEVDADAWERAAIRCAAAVELVHTATLIHDDVLDRASERRGQATVFETHGREAAVAAGDLLFACSFATLVRIGDECDRALAIECVRLLATACRTLAEGEALQADQLRDAALTEADYLRRCREKTGVLFGVALALGSHAGRGSTDHAAALMHFGTEVGTAFQVADDILDLMPLNQADVLGKAPHADLRDGTITLPMVYAMGQDADLAALLAAPVADTESLATRIRDSEGCERARMRAVELVEAARSSLRGLGSRYDLAMIDVIADQAINRLR